MAAEVLSSATVPPSAHAEASTGHGATPAVPVAVPVKMVLEVVPPVVDSEMQFDQPQYVDSPAQHEERMECLNMEANEVRGGCGLAVETQTEETPM